MNVVVNGEPKSLDKGHTIADLLRLLDLDKSACAVEVNRTLIPKARHAANPLAEGDRIEIVTLVGGG